MAGTFELFTESGQGFRFRLIAEDGRVLAVSETFVDKQAAVAGIARLRGAAAMALIKDQDAEASAAAVVESEASGESDASGAVIRNHWDSLDPFTRRWLMNNPGCLVLPTAIVAGISRATNGEIEGDRSGHLTLSVEDLKFIRVQAHRHGVPEGSS